MIDCHSRRRLLRRKHLLLSGRRGARACRMGCFAAATTLSIRYCARFHAGFSTAARRPICWRSVGWLLLFAFLFSAAPVRRFDAVRSTLDPHLRASITRQNAAIQSRSGRSTRPELFIDHVFAFAHAGTPATAAVPFISLRHHAAAAAAASRLGRRG